ncbi:hypothetical protein Y888_16470 [Mixta calida B021323]|nr:hypothetical protein Y888_16470 [Mixta calida B021323]
MINQIELFAVKNIKSDIVPTVLCDQTGNLPDIEKTRG